MKKKKSSIVDIARALNISITTVSFILNGKAKERRISSELVKKVLKFVDEVDYVPNQLAKSLRTGKTNIIGLIVEDISNFFFANIARMIEENANKRGYKIFYCSSENDTTKTRQLIKVFRERQIDGYIITPAGNIEKDIQSLIDDHCSVILFDRYLPNLDTNYVIVDNFRGTYHAIKHLLEQGYSNIAFVTVDSEQTQMQDRLNGYKIALQESSLRPYIKKLPFQANTSLIIDEVTSLLTSRPEIDAVFFATNYLAVAGLEAISTLKLRIPEEIGVVAFDDHDLFRLYRPSITAVAQPIALLSEKVTNILLDRLESDNGSLNTDQVVLPASLIIRNSSIRNGKPALIENGEASSRFAVRSDI
jgi:LacI family transcriptional regulator